MLGIAKTFGVSPKYALYDISYVNALMYSHAVPMPYDKNDNEDNDKPLYDDSKDANNPNNFNDFIEDEESVTKYE